MAIINKYETLRRAFDAAHHINSLAGNLRAQTGSVPFTTVQGHLDSMREAYNNRIAPMLALGTAAQINPQIGTFFVGAAGTPLPASPYAQFQLVGTELMDLFTAYDPVFDTLTPINYDPASGHSDASIPLVQLATLTDELDAVIAAVAPLV